MLTETRHQLSDRSTDSSLRVSDLSCVRGDRLLFDGLNFEVGPAQCLHVIGENGSGKTSLLKILSGISLAESGSVNWRGAPIGEPSFYKDMAYIGHRDGLKNELTAYENLKFYQQLEGNTYDEGVLDQHLALMGLINCADLPTDKLSFGQRRRLAFARLLKGDFPLWILDEPFTGIDHKGRQLIEKLCKAHLERKGMIILTNHQQLTSSTLANYLTEISL